MGVEEYQSRWAYARCAGLSPEESDKIFFVSSGRPRKVPLHEEYCGKCPIVNFCLSNAIIYDEEGIWGGMTKTQRDQLGQNDEEKENLRQALIAEAKRQGWYQERLPVEKVIQSMIVRQVQREAEALLEEPEVDPFDLFAGPQQYYSRSEYTEQTRSKPYTPPVQSLEDVPPVGSDNGQYEDSSVFLFGVPSPSLGNYQSNILQPCN